MRAADVMLEDPVWIDVTATAGEAARKLEDSSIRHLPVLDDGVVVGILSDRDMRSHLPPADTILDDPGKLGERLGTPVSDVMTSEVSTVDPDRELQDVVDIMLEHHYGAVVVVDPGSSKLVGIISTIDILRAMREYVWG